MDRKEYYKKYYQKNKEHKKEYNKKYNQRNKERYKKRYYKNQESCKEWRRQYYKLNCEKIILQAKQYRQSPAGIYQKIKRRQNRKKENLLICSEKEFIKWYNKQEQKCVFCDIPRKLLKPLKWGITKQNYHRFEIDRKNNHRGYTIDNICFACNICNTAKSRLWTFEETYIMAQREIKPIWQQKIKN